jgi:hypothetical protein
MYRFLVPWLGILAIAAALGADAWVERSGRGTAAVAAVSAVLVAGAFLSVRPHFAGRDHEFVRQDVREVAAWAEIGRWFGAHAPPGSTVAVLTAGAIPYYSGLPALDLLGLNDVEIAHTPVKMGAGQAGHEKHNLDYVLRRDPAFVVVGVYGLSQGAALPPVTPYYPVEIALLSSPVFRARYRPVVARTAAGSFTFFARAPSPGTAAGDPVARP